MKRDNNNCFLHVPLVSYINPEYEQRIYALNGAIAAALFFTIGVDVVLWGINGLDFIIRGFYFCFGNLFFPDAQYLFDTNITGQSYESIHRMYEYWVSRGFYSRLIFGFILPAILYGYFFYSLMLYRLKKVAAKMKSENDVKGGTE